MAHRLLCASKTRDVLMGYKDTDRAIAHLEKLREDIRDEMKRRIEQRDKYSIQLTIAVGAIFSFALSGKVDKLIIVAAPMVSLYFTVLILYSYKVHRVLSDYLRNKLENELATLHNIPLEMEWENFYNVQKQNNKEVPSGIRRKFYPIMFVLVTFISLVYLWSNYCFDSPYKTGTHVFLVIITIIYVVSAIWIFEDFRGN